MKQINQKFNVGIILFIIAILLAGLNFIIPSTKILIWALLLISLVYLLFGWYIFKSYYPEGNKLLLFLMGYLYSGVFIAAVFSASSWPMAKTFISLALVWAIIQLLIIIFSRQKIDRKVFIQLIIEAILLLIVAIIFFLKGI
jgi:hypothetical protein